MDPTVVWTAVSSVAGVAAVAVAGWQVRIGIADHRLRQAAARRDGKIGTSAVNAAPSAEPVVRPVRLPPRAPVLAGREDLLAELHARLADGPGPRTVALCGMGGAGKTSIAVEYGHRHLGEVVVCWQLPAEEPVLLEAEFAVLAAELGVRGPGDARDPVASVHAALAGQETEWLLIFDNAPDLASVERFLPPAGPGRVLVTTQSQHWPSDQALQVPVLGTEAAADFLVSRVGRGGHRESAELARELGGLPLALAQAAAYMQTTGISIEAYLPMYRSRQADLLARGEAAGHPATVAVTLGLALSELEDRDPAALGLVRLLAFLAPEPVPLGLLFHDGGADELRRQMPDLITPLLGDPVAIGDSIAALRRYSLASPAGDDTVLVHRLVRAVTRAGLSPEAVAQWKQAAAAMVEAALPANPELPVAYPVCAMLLPHVRIAVNPASDGMSRIAKYLTASGGHRSALETWQQVSDAYVSHEDYGPEHPDALRARLDLAYAIGWGTGNYRRALKHYAGVVSDADRVLGYEHPITLRARDMYAYFTQTATGDSRDALGQENQVIPVFERVLGPEHPDTLVARLHLAVFTGNMGDYRNAIDQCVNLLPVVERILGREHPYTFLARMHLAAFTGGAGDSGDASDQYEELLPAIESALGAGHPYTLRTRSNRVLSMADEGDIGEAHHQFAEFLPAIQRVHGSEHPIFLIARDNYAALTGMVGDTGSAREQDEELIPHLERILGSEHVECVIARSNLAAWTSKDDCMLRFQARYGEAVRAEIIRSPKQLP